MSEPKDFNKPLIAPIKAKMDTRRVFLEIAGIVIFPFAMIFAAVAFYINIRKHQRDALRDHTKDNSHWRIL